MSTGGDSVWPGTHLEPAQRHQQKQSPQVGKVEVGIRNVPNQKRVNHDPQSQDVHLARLAVTWTIAIDVASCEFAFE